MAYHFEEFPQRYVKEYPELRQAESFRVPVWAVRIVFKSLGWLSIAVAAAIGAIVAFPVAVGLIQVQLDQLNVLAQQAGGSKIVIWQKSEANELIELPSGPPQKQRIVFAEKPFTLTIPKIGVDSWVLPNIEAASEASYKPALEQGLAHALGSGFPGQGKLVFIFGHSTNYEWFVAELNAIFFKLKDLEIGDEIEAGQDEKTITYQVIEKKIIEAEELAFIKENLDKDILVLQTCYPPGTTWKRLIIIAEPIEPRAVEIEKKPTLD